MLLKVNITLEVFKTIFSVNQTELKVLEQL